MNGTGSSETTNPTVNCKEIWAFWFRSGRILRPQLILLDERKERRKIVGRSSGEVGTQRIVGLTVNSNLTGLGPSTGVPGHSLPQGVSGMCGSCLPVRHFDEQISSKIKPAMGAGGWDQTQNRNNYKTFPCYRRRSRYILFERHDEGWMKTHRCHDGGKIPVNVCLVSHFLFWTEPQTIMSSDSGDDPDYVPTAPQNDGQYACSWSFNQLTSSFIVDSSSSDSNSDNQRETKRTRTSPPNLTADEETRKKT